jgi:hypothetical protein
LNISDKAIEQMKANLELDEEQMKMAAVEEKKRRRESRLATAYSANENLSADEV